MGLVRLPRGPATPPWAGAACLPVLLAAMAISLAGCGGNDGDGTDQSSSGSGSAASGAKVAIKDYLYEPASITVPVGTTIEFTNRDTTPHTATSKESGAFESGSIDTGRTGEVTLEESGTFAYYCLFHPFMKGTIVVT